MCLPISVLTEGRVSGCNGSCRLLPHIAALIVLVAGMIWNFRPGRKSPLPEESIPETTDI